MKQFFQLLALLLSMVFLAGFSSCYQSTNVASLPTQAINSLPALTDADFEKMNKDEIVNYLKRKASTPNVVATDIVDTKKSLSFSVQNKSGATFYCCSFYYIKNKLIGRWRWEKSRVYKVMPSKTRVVVVNDSVDDSRYRNAVFGYLAVFNNKKEASDAVMETMDEEKLLDLDLLSKIKDKVIEVNVKKYGIRGDRLAYSTTNESDDLKKANPSLSLFLKNETGRDLYLTCFVYEQPESTQSFDLWKYDKMKVIFLKEGEESQLSVPPIYDKYKWSYMRGVLGIFDKDSKELAEKSTFEIVQPINKLELGNLAKLMNQKIILSVENYGVMGDFIDYVVKPSVFVNKYKKVKKSRV